MFSTEMPYINLEVLEAQLSAEDFELVKGIVSTQGTNKNRLRASKPKLPKMVKMDGGTFGWHYDYQDEAGARAGKIAYIWRMVAFMVSPIHQHQCMPCMAYCDLPYSEDRDQGRELEKYLQAIADKVVDTVKASDWHGVKRWAKAFGQY